MTRATSRELRCSSRAARMRAHDTVPLVDRTVATVAPPSPPSHHATRMTPGFAPESARVPHREDDSPGSPAVRAQRDPAGALGPPPHRAHAGGARGADRRAGAVRLPARRATGRALRHPELGRAGALLRHA